MHSSHRSSQLRRVEAASFPTYSGLPNDPRNNCFPQINLSQSNFKWLCCYWKPQLGTVFVFNESSFGLAILIKRVIVVWNSHDRYCYQLVFKYLILEILIFISWKRIITYVVEYIVIVINLHPIIKLYCNVWATKWLRSCLYFVLNLSIDVFWKLEEFLIIFSLPKLIERIIITSNSTPKPLKNHMQIMSEKVA